jgi:WhiB family redox-sensing transcriptional regulator
MPAHVQLPYTTLEVTRVPAQIQKYGQCAGTKTDLFFRDDLRSQQAALAICAQCPLQKVCLEYAIDNEEYGTWGGTTESQRAALRGKTKLVTPEQRQAAARLRETILKAELTVKQIAAAHDVTERTVYRYKERMREDGLLPLLTPDVLTAKRAQQTKQAAKKAALATADKSQPTTETGQVA